MRKISLTKGKFALIDDDDFEKVNKYKWYCNNNGYAVREHGADRSLWMHRFVKKALKYHIVDHINHNRLDNRKCNLRLCNYKENTYNKPMDYWVNKTGYKGVALVKNNKSKPFRATININRKQIHLGYFKTAKEAAIAYNSVVGKYHGKFGFINIIKD